MKTMSNAELNLAIHTEVEGFQWVVGYVAEYGDPPCIPDYCRDPAWCVRMIEKHKVNVYSQASWFEITRYADELSRDASLPRAVALAVLMLTRQTKADSKEAGS